MVGDLARVVTSARPRHPRGEYMRLPVPGFTCTCTCVSLNLYNIPVILRSNGRLVRRPVAVLHVAGIKYHSFDAYCCFCDAKS